MKCKETECERCAYAQGYCKRHYYKARRHGIIVPLGKSPRTLDPVATFMKHHDRSGSGCWEWKGALDHYGYGAMADERCRVIKAHRFSYQFYVGSIPEGFGVLHKCDNPRCINPNHLFLGSQKDNMRDCYRKSRNACGENNGQSKLSKNDVLEIRASVAKGDATRAEMARKFAVAQSTISKIVSGHHWSKA